MYITLIIVKMEERSRICCCQKSNGVLETVAVAAVADADALAYADGGVASWLTSAGGWVGNCVKSAENCATIKV
jgi:hypothetical protein